MLMLASACAPTYGAMRSGKGYTGWPRKNATTLIVNFINIVDETELFLIVFGRTFIFQQNDTMIISFE